MRKTTWTAAAAVLALCGSGLAGVAVAAEQGAAATDASAKRYSAADLFNTTRYGMGDSAGRGFSPDGRSILIVSDRSGVFNAYALPAGGGAPQSLTTSTDDAHFAVSYFPDDARVLVSADGGGDELNHLYVRERDGTLRDLTPGEKVKASFAGWSADGKSFFVTSNERNPQVFDLYAYAADGYARKLVFENPGFEIGAVSRDGRWLALSKPRTSADADVYVADLAAGAAPVLITPHTGNVNHSVFDFTPDSRQLVYATDQHGEFVQAWTHDLASGAKAPLLQADWDVMYVQFRRAVATACTGSTPTPRRS